MRILRLTSIVLDGSHNAAGGNGAVLVFILSGVSGKVAIMQRSAPPSLKESKDNFNDLLYFVVRETHLGSMVVIIRERGDLLKSLAIKINFYSLINRIPLILHPWNSQF